jgi:phage terminase large subunit-like protein
MTQKLFRPAPSLAERLAQMSANDRVSVLSQFSDEEIETLYHHWPFWARSNQSAPPGNWFCWLVLAGRGFGKTRMGVEWIKGLVEGKSPLIAADGAPRRIALIAQTHSDGREVMIDGESGFLGNCKNHFRPKFEASRRRLLWPNGVVAYLYSADEPDQLRGPQHYLAWGDELAKWKYGEACWSNLMFGLRLGDNPRVAITTTPRPIPLLATIMEAPNTIITRGSTFENSAHLSPGFIRQVKKLYEGTRLGRQELLGEILEDVPGALWTRELLDKNRLKKHGPLERIVVAVDPPVSVGPGADACGIIIAARGADDAYYVIGDYTVQGETPNGWAKRALCAYGHFEADRMVAEVNNGGDLVESVLRQLAPQLSYRAVRASRGKIARAEPIAALYERGLVHHVGSFSELEDELCHYTGENSEKSPDRLDALVWALSDLALGPKMDPRIRKF